ncbi:MAG: type II secretion system protein GspC [Desulfococcaceae bacterium]
MPFFGSLAFFQRTAASLISLAGLTAAVYLGVGAFYKIVTARMTASARPVPAAAAAPADAESDRFRPLDHYEPIVDRDLFRTAANTAPPEPKPEPEPPKSLDELKQSDLELQLYGTVIGDPKISYAVIRDLKARQQELFRVGDTIRDATIQRILRNKIVLRRNGEREVLQLADRGAPRRRPVARRPVARSGGAQATTQRIAVSRARVNQAMNNLGGLMKQARIRPHFRNGKPDGLTLSRIRRGSIFGQLGLRSGDIIQGVNGQPVRTVDDALSFYQGLKSSDQVSLEIRRRGQTRGIEYNIR